jgi:large subunit ribosomal protein L13
MGKSGDIPFDKVSSFACEELMRTYSTKPADIKRTWHVIDAENLVLGRLSTVAATLLRGKHKAIFAPHLDTGDFVIVINASKVVMSSNKAEKKFDYRHSGYPGALTATSYSDLLSKKPEFVVEKSIKGMLPHNRLGRAMAKKLKVYAGPEHPHSAQSPVPYVISNARRVS